MGKEEIILKFEHVVKRFGGITASNDINIDVPKGSIYGIIGPNGAGKTTLFNMVTGVYDCTEGEIRFLDQKINGLPTHIIAQKGIARTFQNIRLFGDLSVYENLLTACQKNISYSLMDGILRTRKCRKQEEEMQKYCNTLLKEVGLYEMRDQRANNLPYGMQRRLEIARALAVRPQIILLDEPSLGLAPLIVNDIMEIIKNINKEGISVLLVEQNARKALAIAHQACVLEQGRIVKRGTGKELAADESIIAAYLGKSKNVRRDI